jgi:excisionase family DNA binding protein
MSRRKLNTNNPREFLTLRQASDEIGCTRRFLEKRIEDGELALFKPSKRLVRLHRKELNRWIESYTCRQLGGLS